MRRPHYIIPGEREAENGEAIINQSEIYSGQKDALNYYAA